MVIRSIPEWKTDEAYQTFVQRYLSTGGAFIDEDFASAHTFVWKTLDWEQKAERIAAINERIAAEAWDNPRFVPKPEKFLKSEWSRPILAKAQTKTKQQILADKWKNA